VVVEHHGNTAGRAGAAAGIVRARGTLPPSSPDVAAVAAIAVVAASAIATTAASAATVKLQGPGARSTG